MLQNSSVKHFTHCVPSGVKGLSIDRVALRLHLPPTIAAVDRGVMGLTSSSFDGFLVNEAKGIERFAFIGIMSILGASKICGEELSRVRNG